jgi:hypothetical protein
MKPGVFLLQYGAGIASGLTKRIKTTKGKRQWSMETAIKRDVSPDSNQALFVSL